jgi:hypothetical protein
VLVESVPIQIEPHLIVVAATGGAEVRGDGLVLGPQMAVAAPIGQR